MLGINNIAKTYVPSCEIVLQNKTQAQPSLISRMRDVYIRSMQTFSQHLFNNGWIITHFILGSLLTEPLASLASGLRPLFGMKLSLDKHGFYDAGSKKSLEKLAADLTQEIKVHPAGYFPPVPVLLLHSLAGSPDNFLSWADELEGAAKGRKVGHIITLQLPNEMDARMKLVRQAIADVTAIYNQVLGTQQAQVDLIGYSKGGYAAHMAAFTQDITYEEGIERRWHNIDQRNPAVRKVISVAAATWLCCQGQKELGNHDIYPLKGFTASQIATIHSCHDNIFDFVGTEDAISIPETPLSSSQVRLFKHGHQGMINCSEVCRVALSILAA